MGHLAAEVVLEGIGAVGRPREMALWEHGAVKGPQEMALLEHGAEGVGQRPTAEAHQEQELDGDGAKMALFHGLT